MHPNLVSKKEIILAGFNFYGDPFSISPEWTEENEIGRLWKRFMNYFTNNYQKINDIARTDIAYEVHIENEDTKEKGSYDVFIGFEINKFEISKIENIPLNLLIKVLPPNLYAVFTFKGNEIATDWERIIYKKWMPDSGYKPAYSFIFELYDERYKGLDRISESEIDVYVPIQKVSS